MWKKIRSWVAALMVVCMVAGVMPWNALSVFAADDAIVTSAIFGSDIHEESTGTSGSGSSAMKSIMSQIGSNGKTYETIGFVGDTYSDKAGTMANMTTAAQTALGQDAEVFYAYGDHDEESDISPDSGLMYSGDDYYIYHISDANMRSKVESQSDISYTEAISDFKTEVASMDKSKILFIMSHAPLHDRRDDNTYANDWYNAITVVAETMDVVFFWAHNHTSEDEVDQKAYYVAKDGSETMTIYNGSTVTPNFTYMNAGYIYAAGQNPSRKGVVTTVDIYKDSMVFQDYNSSGEYNGEYAHNVEVAREFAQTSAPVEKTVESIAITTQPTKTEYKVGENLDVTGMVVTATYSDNTTEEIDDFELSDVDMTAEGTKTVTITYGEASTTFEIIVSKTETDGSEEDDNTSDTNTHPAPETATGSGTTTTTTKKTVYVLTSSITSGNDYLIVNGNSAGSYYALANNSGSVAATGVTVKTDSEIGTYIELDDATDELWTVSNSYRFQNAGYYLRYNNSLGLSTSNYTTWSYSGNRLSYSSGRTTYYLRYNSGWTTTDRLNSASSIYFYVPTEIEVETTTTVSGTYSIAGEDLFAAVAEGSTANLISTLTFTPDSGTVTTTDISTTATYEIVTVDANGNTVDGDPSDIISKIENGVVTFTGNYGEALVKVSYKTDFGTVTDYITVEAKAPTYHIDITKSGTVVNDVVTQKGVVNGTTLQLGYIVSFEDEDGTNEITPEEGSTIEWSIPQEYANIASINQDGLVTFKGVDGTFEVFVTYTTQDGKTASDHITISATTTSYTVPSDNTNDFPEYPNEGAIRYDKTAEAVGNFSETGIVKMELSMTGVPYTTGSEIDVVLMLDMTGSMDDVTSSTSEPTGYTRVDATIAAAKTFIKSIVINEDGSYNQNRVGIYVFNKNGAATLYDFGVIDTDAKLESIVGKVGASGEEFGTDYTEGDLDTIYEDHYASGGTPYDDGLAKCQEVLAVAKTDGIGNNRQQFTVFMTDGVPTSYAYVNGTTYGTHSSASSIAGMLTSSDNYATRDTDYKYEYYSTEMKKAGVTVYTVGVGLNNTNNAWSGSATQCLNLASVLLNDISGPANETTQPDAVGTSTLSKKDSYFYSVEDATAATDMKNVFTNIAQKILQAATDVTVEDRITDEYTMIFDIPEGSKDITGVTNDFYIEFVKYTLDEEHERTDAGTSITKLYLKKSNGVYSAASDSAGTAYAAPVFENKTIGDKGTLYYWTTEASHASDSGVSYRTGNTTYYFVPYGIKATDDEYSSATWFNMTSGGYASGTVDSTTNMSDDLIIATPYFVYNAGTKMIYWTVDKLDTTEYALNYFLYLDDSATEVGTNKEVAADTYPTNDHAYITYTNFNGKDCRQEFPIPQMTWNGAQVSYVFYLVNAAGQPINKSGQVVDFANAVFVTEKYTKAVVWNKNADGTIDGKSNLSQTWLAKELLPEDYVVYDESAGYDLYVYASHTGENLFDYFTIKGGNATEISSSLNSRLGLETKADTVSVETTKVYNTKAGTKYSVHGTYTSDETDKFENETVLNNNFDFANTTVAFAVVWQPKLVPDTIVVDYGLDVLINVVQNDLLQNIISGIGLGNTAYGDIAMNTGVATESQLGTAALKTEGGSTISIENENTIRYSQNDMSFDDIDTFYYESPVEFYEESDAKQGYMYSSVTVIPATTVYYEDSFVTFNNSTAATGTYGVWTTDGTAMNATQAQDRPGKSQISETLDADNNYGYDTAYDNCTTFSMGSAKKVLVNAATGAKGANPTATFTFHGTGFDLISVTDNTSGMLKVTVKDSTGATVKTMSVNNYYGYTKDAEGNWIVVESEDENALYQVPVIQITELPQATYTVTVDVMYMSSMDKTGNSEYNIWIDAVRVYDPASTSNSIVSGAYEADGELNPGYIELRDLLLAATDLDASNDVEKDGVVFIDGVPEADIADYEAAGPNNEVYLEAGQAVAFKMVANGKPDGIQLGAKLADGSSAELYLNGALFETLNSATDRNYILDNGDEKEDINHITWTLNETTGLYESNLIVLSNKTENSIISLTNLKAVNAVFVVANSAETASVMSLEEDSYSEISVVSTFAMARAAVDMLNASDDIIVDEPTVEEPEEEIIFKPEKVEISWSSKVKEGKKATLKVITSDDVEAISVDGIMITEYKTKKEKGTKELRREWTYTITAPEAGEYEYEVIVYDAEDNASEPIIATLKVQAHSNGKNKGGR